MSSRPRLIPLDAPCDVKVRDLQEAEVIVFGRSLDLNVSIDSESVSRRHACIMPADGFWVFVDLGSTNGSWINTQPISPGQLVLLRHGDLVQVADVAFRFVCLGPDDREPQDQCLLVFQGEKYVMRADFDEPDRDFVIGALEGDLVLGNASYGDGRVVVSLSDSTFWISADSSLPVMLNGQNISGDYELADRFVIAIGLYNIVVCDSGTAIYPEIEEGIPPETSAETSDSTSESHLQDWGSQRKQEYVAKERRNIFGSDDNCQTVAMPRKSSGVFEGSSHVRLSGRTKVADELSNDDSEDHVDMVSLLAGIVLLVGLVAGAAYWFIYG